MPRKLFQRYSPNQETIKSHRFARLLGQHMNTPGIWHFSRRSVTRAILVGTMLAFMPLPLQMLLAVILAIVLRINLPICLAFVCITNPLTAVPLFFMAYKIGLTLFNIFGLTQDVVLISSDKNSLNWLIQQLKTNWQPFILGCFVTGLFLGLLLQFIVDLLWRWHVLHRWRNRLKKPNHR